MQCRDRDTLDGGSFRLTPPQPSNQTWCLLDSVTPPLPPLSPSATWSGPRQSSWLPGSQKKSRTLFFSGGRILSRKGLNWDKSRESFPLFVLVFIYNLFTLLIIYLHNDLWQVSEIFIIGMFFLFVFVCWSFFKMEIKTCFTAVVKTTNSRALSLQKVLSGLVNRFKTCLTVLYGI